MKTRHIPLALYLVAALWLLPTGAQAQRGVYTTKETSTTTSGTDATTGITTTRTVTEREQPRNERWRDRGRNRGDDRTSDIDARYPYDSSNGQNRSDVDAVRSGFDDPRNPWDGRYTNDNPRNSEGSLGSNATVNSMRGEPRYSNDRYRPGSYGTRSMRNRD